MGCVGRGVGSGDERRAVVEDVFVEAGDVFVGGGGVFEFFGGEDVGDVGVAVGGAGLDHLHHLLGAVLAVGEDDAGGDGVAFGFEGVEGGGRLAVGLEFAGEDAGVDDGLGGAVGADGVHGVGGVTEEGGAAVGPGLEWVAVDHGEFVDVFGALDEFGDVEPVEDPVGEVGEEVGWVAGAVPVFAVPGVVGGEFEFGDPVGEGSAGVVGGAGDGVGDEFLEFVAGHDHRAAGEEGGAFGDAAPEDGAVPDGGAFVGVVFGAKGRVDAVGADEEGAFGGGGVFEVGADGGGGFFVVGEVVGLVDVGVAEAGAGGLEEEHLEFAAVDGELGPVVAGFAAAGFVPDGAAVAGVVGEFLGGDGEGGELGFEAEFAEFADGVGEEVDADAEGAGGLDAFEDLHRDADLVEAEGEGEAGDAAAGDQDGHRVGLAG